jgi:hypothetical protein
MRRLQLNPLGDFAQRREPLLDLGSRDKSNQPLVGDRPDDCDQGDGRQPADRQYRDPDIPWRTRPRTHRPSRQSKPQPLELPGGNGGNGGTAHFIFANLNGTISPGTQAPRPLST